MKHLLLALTLLIVSVSSAVAEPTVLILPFDPIMDSVYGIWGDKESVLNYRTALQQMLVADLSKFEEIWVVEPARLKEYQKESREEVTQWNDTRLASRIGAALGADYAVIGTYGEFSREIRVDARVVVTASGDVPPGHAVTATVGLWEDLPTAASQISGALVPIVTASGRLRPTSKGRLFPEGDLAAYDPNRTAPAGQARLVVWVNGPAPTVRADNGAEFGRCDRIDLMDIPTTELRRRACRVALLPAGTVHVTIEHRGYLPYIDVLNLAAGKAYRLEVDLKPVETQLPR